MSHYVGLDVSHKSVFVCILDEKGKVVREAELVSHPDAVSAFLFGTGLAITKVGLESGSLTHWLTKGLRNAGFHVTPMESRKMAAILATVINKTDQNDARGIAEALRAGHYKECVHRSDDAMEVRTVLHARSTLVRERTHLTSSIKGHLKVYGIKLGAGRRKGFSQEVEEAIESRSEHVKVALRSLLKCLEVLDREIAELDKCVKSIAKNDEDIRILKTIDGIGDITALAYKAELDDPKRFLNSRDVGAYIGLTPRQYSSGEVHKQGRISKQGSKEVRHLLVEAANVILTRCKVWSSLKAFGMRLMKKKGKKKAEVAVARKLAVIMHKMLLTKQEFKRSKKEKKEEATAA